MPHGVTTPKAQKQAESLEETLVRLRVAKKLARRVAAQLIGVTQPALTHWECGRTRPRIGQLELLDQFYQAGLVEKYGNSCAPPPATVLVEINPNRAQESAQFTPRDNAAPGRTLVDLNEHLFRQLERLDSGDLAGEALICEINRSRAVAEVGREIISNAALALKAQMAVHNSYSAEFNLPKMIENN